MVTMAPVKITHMAVELLNQETGNSPINTSRIVPPPMAVAKEMIKTPKGSNFFSIAANAPATAKLNVPSISMILIKLSSKETKIKGS